MRSGDPLLIRGRLGQFERPFDAVSDVIRAEVVRLLETGEWRAAIWYTGMEIY